MNKKRSLLTVTICIVIIFLALVVWSKAEAVDRDLTWKAPTTNDDACVSCTPVSGYCPVPCTIKPGTPLTDLAGFKVYYGTASGIYGPLIDVENVTTYRVTGLLYDTTYYFAVKAYDVDGNLSPFSNEISRKIMSIPASPILTEVKQVLYTNLNIFPDVPKGTNSMRTMIMQNDSKDKVIISKVEIIGSDFRTKEYIPQVLIPKQSLIVQVFFKPIEKGLRLGKISIVTDKGLIEKPLSGNGI